MALREDFTDLTLFDEEGKIEYFYNPITEFYDLRPEELIGTSFLQQYVNIEYDQSTIVKAVNRGISTLNYEEELITERGSKSRQVSDTYVLKSNDGIIGALEIARFDHQYQNQVKRDKGQGTKVEGNKKITLDDLICASDEMLEIKRKIKKIINLESPILITGEAGTGKETIARTIHDCSNRSEREFIYINCAAIPEGLIEGILFGTEKGSFTDAQEKLGLFRAADKGTLYLDEINSMPIQLQGKILRAIEEKRIRPVGSSEEVPIDTRVIASCNEPVQSIIKDKRIRKDLYFRLAVIQLEIPALRERKRDIPAVAKHYLKRTSLTMGSGKEIQIHEDGWELVREFDWPGNVRQLRNTLEGLALAAENGIIKASDIAERLYGIGKTEVEGKNKVEEFFIGGRNLKEYMDAYAKEIIQKNIAEKNKDLKAVANTLGISMQMLKYNIKKYQIEI